MHFPLHFHRHLRSCAWAVASTIAALWLTWHLGLQVTGGVSPLFFAAVMFSAYMGGLTGGLVATSLAALMTALFIQAPHNRVDLELGDLVRLAVFTAVALLITSLQHAVRVALQRAEAEREAAEAARAEAIGANAAKDRFLNVLGHELRNPLTPILAAVSLRLRELGPATGDAAEDTYRAELREDFELIRRNIEVEARLIDDLLDSRRIHTGKLRLLRNEVDLKQVVGEVVEAVRPAAEAKNLVLRWCPDARTENVGTPIVDGDATRLRQVFWNLFNNAIKFTDSGQVRVGLRSARGGKEVVVTVADTGPGLEAAAARSAFRPFVQLHREANPSAAGEQSAASGLGLGLSIVDGLVTAHAGQVSLRTRRGGGCVFRVRLPTTWRPTQANQWNPSTPADPGATAASRGRGRRILFVEDHVDTARITARLLRRHGYHVRCAHSCAAALVAAREERFDMVVSDISLGDGDGRDLMTRLHAGFGLAGIAVSGFATETEMTLSAKAGFAFHLVKPVPIEYLCDHIDRVAAVAAA